MKGEDAASATLVDSGGCGVKGREVKGIVPVWCIVFFLFCLSFLSFPLLLVFFFSSLPLFWREEGGYQEGNSGFLGNEGRSGSEVLERANSFVI